MEARDLPVGNDHVTGGFASKHNGMAQGPALTFERPLFRDQHGKFFCATIHSCPQDYLEVPDIEYTCHSEGAKRTETLRCAQGDIFYYPTLYALPFILKTKFWNKDVYNIA
jgi:hypothetical protein